jgi:predicted porin
MKKILLGTTGLIGAALLATVASAETPKVTLGGSSNFQAGWTSNDDDVVSGDDDRSMAFRNDNEISVRVDGKTNSGLGYGAVVELEADITGDNDNSPSDDDANNGINDMSNATRTFTYLEGGWGRTELGGNKGAAATMRVDASTLAVATGGINGDWRHFVNVNGTTETSGQTNQITTSKLQMEHGGVDFVGDESTYNITKATYYTPRFSGFQGGLSYSPDVDNIGQIAQRRDDAGQDGYGNIWEAGLGYEGQFSGVKFAASLAGNWASADDSADDDISGWNAGALVGWNNFSVAGSYGKWSEGAFTVDSPGSNSLIDTALTDADGDYWTLGAAYNAGAFGVSATYLDSEFDVGGTVNEFNNLVFGADYKLAPGLTPYVEVAMYDFDPTGTANDNDGTSVILGTSVNY